MSTETNGVDSPEVTEQTVDSAARSENQPAGDSRTISLEEADARIKARIDKQNAKHAQETDALEKHVADAKAAQEDAETRAKEAEAKVAELQHEKDLRAWADEASVEFGVPANIIKGNSLEEMKEHAAQIKAAIPSYPTLSGDNGEPGTPSITKEEIQQIKNRSERIAAIAANPDAFK